MIEIRIKQLHKRKETKANDISSVETTLSYPDVSEMCYNIA